MFREGEATSEEMSETRKKKLTAGVSTVACSGLAAGEPETGAIHQP